MPLSRPIALFGFTFAAAAVTLALSSCQKEAPHQKLTAYGSVQLVDEYGRPEADLSGIKVELVSDRALPAAYTNAQGSYSIAMYPGKNHLEFSKQGFGTYRLPLTLIDNSNLQQPAVKLGRVASASVTSLQVVTRRDTLFISGRMSLPNLPGHPPRQHRLFFFTADYSPDPPLPNTTATAASLTLAGTTNVGTDAFVDTLALDRIRRGGFVIGRPVEVVGYGDNRWAPLCTQMFTNDVVYPALSLTGSNVVSFPRPL